MLIVKEQKGMVLPKLSKFLKIMIIIYNHDDNEFCCFFFSFSVNSGLMANVKKAFTGEVK